MHPQHPQRRQSNTEPPNVPSVSGISGGAVTVAISTTPTSGLVFASTVSGNPQGTAPPLAAMTSFTLNNSPSPVAQTSTTNGPSSSNKSSATVNPIPISTVVGACVAAFVGAAIVILAGWWLYKRSYSKSKRKMRSINNRAAAATHNRNYRGKHDRSKYGSGRWARLEEADAKWENEYQTNERQTTGFMEKLSMREKSSSSRSMGRSSTERLSFDTSPYSAYHHNLAEELAEARRPQFLANVDTGGPISWGNELVSAQDPFITIRESRLTASAVSPSRNAAIPTPQAVSIESHQWESAVVMDYEAELASSRARKNSSDRDRHTRHKGKDRAQDPFSDQFATSKPDLPTLHVPSSSNASTMSDKERALQSLIAALDISREEVEERLHVASMKTPTRSPSSPYASHYIYEEDVTSEFPLPHS